MADDGALHGLREGAAAAVSAARARGLAGEEAWLEALRSLIGGPQQPGAPGNLAAWQITGSQLLLVVRGFLELIALAAAAREGWTADAAGDEWTALAALPALPREQLDDLGRRAQALFSTDPAAFLRREAELVGMMHRAVSFWLTNVRGGLRDLAPRGEDRPAD